MHMEERKEPLFSQEDKEKLLIIANPTKIIGDFVTEKKTELDKIKKRQNISTDQEQWKFEKATLEMIFTPNELRELASILMNARKTEAEYGEMPYQIKNILDTEEKNHPELTDMILDRIRMSLIDNNPERVNVKIVYKLSELISTCAKVGYKQREFHKKSTLEEIKEMSDKARLFWSIQNGEKPETRPKIVEISGFDEFDDNFARETTNQKTEKIIMETGFLRIMSTYVREIFYEEARPVASKYGIKGKSAGVYYDGGEKGDISLAKPLKTDENFSTLMHELGHATDPTISNELINIAVLEQIELVKKWLLTRQEEAIAITDYVKEIKNTDKTKETSLKRIEDWAESFMLFVLNRDKLKEKAPQREAFFREWFEKYHPEFDLEGLGDQLLDLNLQGY